MSWAKNTPQDRIATSLKLIEHSPNAMFTEVFSPQYQDYEAASPSSLKGAIVSIKDLFDVKGYHTRCGSTFLESNPPAQEDAAAVAALRKAGALLLGHTNMTELAYSGLGLNPHYGTPEIPDQPGRIAGGSTSGGAASVAAGVADIALGTDTGGSLRIPATFCGLTGFKPSQDSISRQGCWPLSDSLDSVGVIAHTVSQCELAWQTLSESATAQSQANKDISLVIPSNFGLTDLDEVVSTGFAKATEQLKQANMQVTQQALPVLEGYKALPIWQFSAVEGAQYYGAHTDLDSANIDPRVKSRLDRSKEVSSDAFLETLSARKKLIEQYNALNRVLLLPTVPIASPRIDSLEDDENYNKINLLCLRNTSLANVLDACSISIPYKHQGENIGLMLIGPKHQDSLLLSIAKEIEMNLSPETSS